MTEDTLQTLSASTVIGTQVINPEGEDLGEIEDLILDLDAGCLISSFSRTDLFFSQEKPMRLRTAVRQQRL